MLVALSTELMVSISMSGCGLPAGRDGRNLSYYPHGSRIALEVFLDLRKGSTWSNSKRKYYARSKRRRPLTARMVAHDDAQIQVVRNEYVQHSSSAGHLLRAGSLGRSDLGQPVRGEFR